MQSVVQFVVDHQTVLAAAAVAVIDVMIALNPKWESNSIIQALLSIFKKKPAQAA